MALKGEFRLISTKRWCGKCGEFKTIRFEGQIYCLDCGQKLRTKPRNADQKEKYKICKGY